MFKKIPHFLQVYGLAGLTAAAALATTLLLRSWLPPRPAVLFLAAVMISARYGGIRSGLTATLLAVASVSYFFFSPVFSLAVYEFENVVWLSLFIFVSVLISSLNESRKQAEERLRAANQNLEKRVAERTDELTRLNEKLEVGYAALEQITADKERIIQELQSTLAQVRALKGMLPVCVHCQKIRDNKGDWKQLESYLSEQTEDTFSRSVCPDCGKQIYTRYPFIDKVGA